MEKKRHIITDPFLGQVEVVHVGTNKGECRTADIYRDVRGHYWIQEGTIDGINDLVKPIMIRKEIVEELCRIHQAKKIKGSPFYMDVDFLNVPKE